MSSRPPPANPHSAAVRVPGIAPSGDTESARTARFDAAALCSCELATELGPAGPILVLHAVGEIDLFTLPVLQQALTAAIEKRPADLVVDLAAVGFCCVRGFAVLASAAGTAQTKTNRTGYALSGLPPHLDRFATLLWPEQRCVRYRSAAAAVTAIRIEQTHRPT